MFSTTLLVEQGWSQLISLCPPAIASLDYPFRRSEDESVSEVLYVSRLAPQNGWAVRRWEQGVTNGVRADTHGCAYGPERGHMAHGACVPG